MSTEVDRRVTLSRLLGDPARNLGILDDPDADDATVAVLAGALAADGMHAVSPADADRIDGRPDEQYRRAAPACGADR